MVSFFPVALLFFFNQWNCRNQCFHEKKNHAAENEKYESQG